MPDRAGVGERLKIWRGPRGYAYSSETGHDLVVLRRCSVAVGKMTAEQLLAHEVDVGGEGGLATTSPCVSRAGQSVVRPCCVRIEKMTTQRLIAAGVALRGRDWGKVLC